MEKRITIGGNKSETDKISNLIYDCLEMNNISMGEGFIAVLSIFMSICKSIKMDDESFDDILKQLNDQWKNKG